MIRTFLRGLVGVIALLVVASASASAQMASASRFGISAGVALPMGDFGDAVGLGIQSAVISRCRSARSCSFV